MKEIWKKYLIFGLLVALYPVISNAQYQTGIKSGIGLGWMNIEDDTFKADENSSSFSYLIGAYVKRKINKNSVLGLEILFTSFNSKDTYEDVIYTDPSGQIIGTGSQKFNYEFYYVNMPIYYGFILNNWEVDLGINPIFHLSSRIKVKDDNIFNNYPVPIELSTEAARFSFGLNFNVSYSLFNNFNILASYYGNILTYSISPDRENSKRLASLISLGVSIDLVNK